MILQHMKAKDYAKAIGVGIGTGVLLSLIMVPAARAGISPMPKPLGLAFAQLLLGKVPLPVGILFHIAYVTFWSVVYVIAFQRRTFLKALWLALGLWALVLVFSYPLVGWGFLGLAVSPMLIMTSLVLHILFAIFLWGLSRLAFPLNAQDRLARA
jgi:hypothetical protein